MCELNTLIILVVYSFMGGITGSLYLRRWNHGWDNELMGFLGFVCWPVLLPMHIGWWIVTRLF